MLTSKQKKLLKALAHRLKPLTNIGKGELSKELTATIQRYLFDHELIKVKILNTVTTPKAEVAQKLAEATGAEMVNLIGKTIILYKKTDKEGLENIDINKNFTEYK